MSKAPNLKAVCQGKNSHEVVIAAIRQAGTLWFCGLELWLYGSGLGHYCRSIHRLGGLRAGGMSRVKFEFISAALISGRHMFLYVRVGNNASQRDIPEVSHFWLLKRGLGCAGQALRLFNCGLGALMPR